MTAVPDIGLNASQPNLQTACAFSVERVRIVGPTLTDACAAVFQPSNGSAPPSAQPTTAGSSRGRSLGVAPLFVLIALIVCVGLVCVAIAGIRWYRLRVHHMRSRQSRRRFAAMHDDIDVAAALELTAEYSEGVML